MKIGIKFLWTSGKNQRPSAVKFFALAFTFITLVGFTCQTFGLFGATLPPATEMLLGIFWGGYIANKRAKDWINSKQDTAPGSGEE
jgi:hypothetical protein